jgi:hypothetical protein
MSKLTKTQIAIEVLKANASRSLVDVIPLIMSQCDLSEKNAYACYRLRVKADASLALTGAKSVKAPVKSVAIEKAKTRTVKRMAAEVIAKAKPKSKEVSAESLLPDSELAKIKAANLARLKAASSRKVYANVARPEGPGVVDFDADSARAEVSGLIDSLESFQAPKFLSKAQVKALV